MPTVPSHGRSARLYAVATVVAIALAAVATFAWLRLDGIANATSATRDVRVPQLDRIAKIELNITRVSLQVRHTMLSRSPEERAATLSDIGEKRKTIERLMAEYDATITTPKGRDLFNRLKPAVDRFWEVGGANLKLVLDGQNAEAFEFLVSRTIPARNAVLEQAEGLVMYQRAMLDNELSSVKSKAAQTLGMLLALVVAAMLGLALFAWRFAAQLRRRIGEAQTVAERVRAGDLSRAVIDHRRDEFSPLLSALHHMQQGLTPVVGSVRHSAKGVASTSQQITNGSQDLNARTEQQAGSLQQAAASMGELGDTVRQNADNARRANDLAVGASRVAQDGGTVVAEVVGTLKGIHASSRRIADIMGVIDGIAFQTNILALNAAVEAARAGEQGAGVSQVGSVVGRMDQATQQNAAPVQQSTAAAGARQQQARQLVQAVEVFRLQAV